MTEVDAVLGLIERRLSFVPEWLAGLIMLMMAGLLAILIHAAIANLVRRTIATRHPFLGQLLSATRGPTRLALIVFALGVVLPSAPFDPSLRNALGHMLLLAFIVLAGWMALTATEVAAAVYLRRFRIDVEDNLLARKHVTQVKILRRALDTLIVIITTGALLMTFESVRQYGVSLFASAGVAGLAVGFAARPVLQNLIAGVQIAMTQPIRLDDVVVVENETGSIEEITATYVVIRLWDLRRLIVPLTYFIEKPFQNHTRESAALIGTVMLQTDYAVPVERLRAKAEEIVKASPLWDGQVLNLQVTEAREHTLELRALVSARSGSATWDLRCELREKLIAYLQTEYPQALPRMRADIALQGPASIGEAPKPPARRAASTRRPPQPEA